MEIYIPSRGRSDSLWTWHELPERWKRRTFIVCHESEADQYRRSLPRAFISPCPIHGIHNVRQWICDNAHSDFVFMLDDDMRFAQRADDWEKRKIYKPQLSDPEEIGKIFDLMENWLEIEGFAHVGIGMRQMNVGIENRWWREAARMNNAYGYNLKILREEGIRWDRLEVMEDFDVTLELLKRGYPNRITVDYVWNQRGSGLAGGCSSYRNNEMQERCARRLVELHAPFVQLVVKEKTDSSKWIGMQSRHDVRISWRKAFPGVVDDSH